MPSPSIQPDAVLPPLRSVELRGELDSRPMAERHIVGLGGGGDAPEQTDRLYEYILGLSGKERPRVLFIPTAANEDDSYIVWFYERFARRGEASHLNTFPWPPENLREVILSQDVINVSGGNTANMLAI